MFRDDDLDPQTKKHKPRVLDALSIPELKDYVQDLKAEIQRVEGEIAKKERQRAAADAVFGCKEG